MTTTKTTKRGRRTKHFPAPQPLVPVATHCWHDLVEDRHFGPGGLPYEPSLHEHLPAVFWYGPEQLPAVFQDVSRRQLAMVAVRSERGDLRPGQAMLITGAPLELPEETKCKADVEFLLDVPSEGEFIALQFYLPTAKLPPADQAADDTGQEYVS